MQQFAELSGDHNPVHMDEDFAKKTQFKHRIAHGMITAAFISTCLAEHIPGQESCIYLDQTLRFAKPVYLNDTLTVKCTITKFIPKKNFTIVVYDTIVTNQDNIVVTSGQAQCMATK